MIGLCLPHSVEGAPTPGYYSEWLTPLSGFIGCDQGLGPIGPKVRNVLPPTWQDDDSRVGFKTWSGNPPPAPQSGFEIRRSICSADGALEGAIGV